MIYLLIVCFFFQKITSCNPLATILSQKSLVRNNCISTDGKIGNLNVLQACLVKNYNDKLIIDSRATNHVCYSLEWFKQSIPLSKGQRSLKLGNEQYVFIVEVGLMELCFDNKTLRLSDCFLVIDFKRNLVSVSCLVERGLIEQFNSSISIKSNNTFICSKILMNGLYFLTPLSYSINSIEHIDDEQLLLSKKMKV